jgi:adenylate cyclase
LHIGVRVDLRVEIAPVLHPRVEIRYQTGVDVSDLDPDTQRLVKHLLDQGVGRRELSEAIETGWLGPLALEVALRGPGEPVPFARAAADAGLEPEEAAALWRALGFPDPLSWDTALWPSQVQTLGTLAGMGKAGLGDDTALQLARVIGSSVALLAEALVDAFRVKVEMPARNAGTPYSEVVDDYARAAPGQLSALSEAIGDVLRAHVVAVGRSRWALDESQATVTRERTVGFADLVGYTANARYLSPSELSGAISRFESVVGEAVNKTGGRVVKLIGDEAMFVLEDQHRACELALELASALGAGERPLTVRIGLASGEVVAHHGDYYGEVVNLAARLVKVADPGEVLVSRSVAEKVSGAIGLEEVQTPPLKGYDRGVSAFRLARG